MSEIRRASGMDKSELRSLAEIQYAHDFFHGIMLGEIPSPFDESGRIPCAVALQVLCWVLQHSGGEPFAERIRDIERHLRASGIDISKVQ